MFKLYNRIIYFLGTVGNRMEQEFLSKALDAFSFVECWGVLRKVFFGVILNVFKRSVACPGHGSQHVYGVTIIWSCWFYIKKGHREVLFRAQCGRPVMLLLNVVHLVSSFSPKVLHESALGAMKSANLLVKVVTGGILLKCLTAHTHRGDAKRVFDLVL